MVFFRTIFALLILTGMAAGPKALLAQSITGHISDNQRITATQLGYAIQYRVYTPPGYDKSQNLPTLYVTDGQWYIRNGQLDKIATRLIKSGTIKPTVIIFVDSRDPDKLSIDRRSKQFFCVPEYVDFYRNDLIPAISKAYKVSQDRRDRAIMGMSFGGLNAGCFGIMAYDQFEGIAMLSPAMHPIPKFYDIFNDGDFLPIKIFLSTGKEPAINARTIKLRRALERRGYPLLFKRSLKGHNWANWKPMLDDILIYFFKEPKKHP